MTWTKMGLLFCDDAPMNSNYVPLNTYISIDSEEIIEYEYKFPPLSAVPLYTNNIKAFEELIHIEISMIISCSFDCKKNTTQYQCVLGFPFYIQGFEESMRMRLPLNKTSSIAINRNHY
jgi:hypothetical protein